MCGLNGGEIRVAELFAGIGGFRLGLEQASQRYKTVYANEWNKYAAQIYRKHWNDNTLHEADITQVDASNIPDCELVVGGFPCQPFSIGGKRKGFADFRGTLFFEIARIAEHKRPKILLLENVKSLLSAQEGFCFLSILDKLDELGYNVEGKVLNTKYWLPQTRERTFLIGHLREKSRSQVLRFGETESSSIEEISGGQQTAQLAHCLTATDAKQHGDGNYVLMTNKAIPVLTPQRINKRQNGRRFRNPGEEMFTLTAQDIHGVCINDEIRILTEIEEERLQGFPDNWTLGISRCQRYKCLGNAVSVPVIKYLGELLLEAFD